jgi:hypothetical protein
MMKDSLDADPTDFDGAILSFDQFQDYDEGYRKPTSNAATGASAAGIRALSSQIVSFYFRAPVKSFMRTRVE